MEQENTHKQDQEPLVFESDADLNVTFAEKDAAKALGAWWNPDKRIWYVCACWFRCSESQR